MFARSGSVSSSWLIEMRGDIIEATHATMLCKQTSIGVKRRLDTGIRAAARSRKVSAT
jgi:hypothetical protein